VWVSDLDPVAYPLAAVYAAIHRYVLWYHLPSQRPADVTEGGTAHFLVVRLQFTMCRRRPKLASIKHVVSASTRVKPLCYPPRRIRIARAPGRGSRRSRRTMTLQAPALSGASSERTDPSTNAMIEEERPRLELAQRLQAIENAIDNARP
jgi:hypothetical protein